MPVMRLRCEDVERAGMVEAYLAELLRDPELEAFESHFIDCDRCQAELRMGAAVRQELRGATGRTAEDEESRGAAIGAEVDGFSTRRRLALVGGVMLAAAAAVAALMLLPGGAVDPALTALGGVGQPPIYLGIEVRSERVPGEAALDEGMAAYRQERWNEAVRHLGAALDAGMEPLPATFFQAAAHLMADRPAEAAAGFGRVIDLGDTPYATEAHFYLAKALLRTGEGERALAELERAAAAAIPGVSTHAGALADSVRQVLER